MSMQELLPTVSALPRLEKLRLMEWLTEQLAKEEVDPNQQLHQENSVWSPYGAYEASATLAVFLEKEKTARQ